MPIILIAIAAAYFLLRERPDVLSQLAGGANWDSQGVTDGTTPFAQSLISTAISPMGSKLNPRLMTYTTYAVTLPAGSTRSEADAIINGRGSNIPIHDFGFSGGVLYLTVKTNDAGELAVFDQTLNAFGYPTAVTSRRTVKYYLLANNWVSEDDVDAWIADCPRQKALNPGVGFGECPTSF